MITVYMMHPCIGSSVRNVYVIPRAVCEPWEELTHGIPRDWVHVARCMWCSIKRRAHIVWFDPKGFDVTRDDVADMSIGSVIVIGASS